MRPHPYDGLRAALLTKHGKEQVIAPALRDAFNIGVDVVGTIDTDTLGTFTRDVPRAGTQLEAARKKATLACEQTGSALGLGSEGSFAPGPYGLGTWNLELVVLVVSADRAHSSDVREIRETKITEVVGRAYEPGLHHHALVSSIAELENAAHAARFPEHGLVLRPDCDHDRRIRKDMTTWSDLERAFCAAIRESDSGRVFVENDLRAHHHPSRMAVIAKATADLVERLQSLCAACGSPGFGRVAAVPGLPCQDCGAPTDVPIADDYACVACAFRERRLRGVDSGSSEIYADPSRCNDCNP